MDVAGGSYNALATFFHGVGAPFSGCGVPGDMLKDSNGKPLPFVALNTNGPFDEGANCGRWIEVDLGNNCDGAGNSLWTPCDGGGETLPDSSLPTMK